MGETRAGEIDFTDDELDELGIELADGGKPKKKAVMRVPLDEVPRAKAKDPSAAARQPKFSPSDLAVETAFEKLNGAAKHAAPAADSPWDSDDSNQEEEDLVIDEDLPSSPTSVSPPPAPEEIAPEMTDRYDEDATDVARQAVAPLPSLEDEDDGIPISSAPPYEPTGDSAAYPPARAPDPPAPPLAAGPAAAPAPPPVPDDEGMVLSSAAPPDRSGPRVAVGADTSGRVAIAAAAPPPAPPSGLPVASATPPPMPAIAPPPKPAPAAAPEDVEIASEEIEEVKTPRPVPPPLTRENRPTQPIPVLTPADGAPSTIADAPTKPIPAAPPPVPAGSAPPPVPAGAESDDRPRRRRRAKQWFEEIFDEDYLRTLPFMTARQTERESAFILDALGVQNQANLLDLACGYGRHAMELAARGHKVTGLDLSLPLLIRAADAARRVGVNVNFVHGDMRELSFDAEFDAAYSFFTSFGYFDDDSNRKVAALVAKSLKPGGRFLLDVINRDYLIGDLPTRVWWQGDGCVVLEEVDFNYFTSRLQVQRSIVFEDGRQVEQEISIRAYSLHEIGKVLHHAGFRVIEVSGGLALRGRFYGSESRQLMVVAEKKKEP